YIKQHQIKIIHASQKPRDALWGVLLGKLTGAKSLVHHHIKCEQWMGPLAYWAMRHADGGIACSTFVAQSVVKIGCLPDTIHPVLNSLDSSLWDDTIDGTAIRREFGIAPDAPLLATIARQNQWKGADKVMKAITLIKQDVPHVKFLVVGDGV